MDCFRIETVKNTVFPKNLKREDETLIFERVQSLLLDAGAKLEEKKELPECDIVDGVLDETPFILFLDLCDGTEIKCDDPDILDKIQRIIESE